MSRKTIIEFGRHERVSQPSLAASVRMMSAAAISSAARCAIISCTNAAAISAFFVASTKTLSSTLPMMPPSPMNSDAILSHMARLEAEPGLDHGDVAVVLQQHDDGALQAPRGGAEPERDQRRNDEGASVHHATFPTLA